MLDLLRRTLDLSYTPTWAQILMDFAGAIAAFIIPAAFALVAVAFGWGPR
jgi:hypothetical protein